MSDVIAAFGAFMMVASVLGGLYGFGLWVKVVVRYVVAAVRAIREARVIVTRAQRAFGRG